MKHLTIRVAWHDNKWNGTICKNPLENTYCLSLPRIYEEKDENVENKIACKSWADKEIILPPCKAESGAFMNEKGYKRKFSHPYRNIPKVKETHGHLKDNLVEVPVYSTFAVPFRWMLKANTKELNEKFPTLPKDEKPPFNSPWVFGKDRQLGILKEFFRQLEPKSSLVFFYSKSGNPVDEEARRLLVGIGTITSISNILIYEADKEPRYPLWDRIISHSIRPDKANGFLIPYHDYLEPTGDEKEDGKRRNQLNEIKVILYEPGSDERIFDQFSYGSELLENSYALSILIKLRKVIELIKDHGVASGPWDKRLYWVNDKIGKVKEMLGPYPAFGDALVVLGLKQGHFFSTDIYRKNLCEPKGDPWKVFESIINNKIKLPEVSYAPDLPTIKDIWNGLPGQDKELLKLLSRFEIDSTQITLWFDEVKRKKKGILHSAGEIIRNPYLIAEDDVPDSRHYPISVETIDLGLFPDKAIQGENQPEPPTKIESELDKRRIRAVIIQILKMVAEEGDTLLSFNEIKERLDSIKLSRSCTVPKNYLEVHSEFLKDKLSHITNKNNNSLQLKIYDTIETELSKIFLSRAKKTIPIVDEDWKRLILETLKDSKTKFEKDNERHVSALNDQINALKILTSRKLTILHGAAGTGKTSVMGSLFKSKELRKGGILLLAPTGKARVKLGQMANSEAFTIAQFLTKQGRYRWATMKPLFNGKELYSAERTVIIDECSMLTVEDFYAIFKALDMSRVNRIILVGDPSQLPPIGPGKPFYELCNYLSGLEKDQEDYSAAQALAKLDVIVRTRTDGESDALTLASWYSGEKPKKNADIIFDKIETDDNLNDLSVKTWKTPEDIEPLIRKTIIDELGLKEKLDLAIEFSHKALGYKNDRFPLNEPENVENFQILTPVRNPVWGSYNINRFIQQEFRNHKFQGDWEKPFGDQRIWQGDKVIQLVNEKRSGYNFNDGGSEDELQLSNGQVGIVFYVKKGFANVAFSGIPSITFGFSSKDFKEDKTVLELAYSITIHKSQGSEFKKVFLILPKKGRILSRELIYTALTRAKENVTLLIEGDSPAWIYKYSKPENSESARRNSNMLISTIRDSITQIPFADKLIHRTLKPDLFVRSKSEVVIANMLYVAGIEFDYERKYEGDNTGGYRLPDFSFVDPAGDLIIWEHLGMLHKPSYKEDWEKKKKFYFENDIKEGERLFTTRDNEDGAIDSKEIEKVLNQIKALV